MRSEITFTRLQPDVKLALTQAAAADGRSLSAMIAKIVSDWLKAQKAAA